MNNDDIIRALNHTNAPSELVEVIVAALTELDATLTESTANMIALQYVKEDYEQLRAENAALRARLDDCAAALLADAEGR